MTPHPTFSARRALPWLLALAWANAPASPNHDSPAPAAAPAAAKAAATDASPAKPAAGGATAAKDAAPTPPPTIDRKILGLDTLEQLREKLSQRIGATKAVDRKSVVVMQVATPAGNDLQVSPRAVAASARSTRPPGATKAGGAAKATAAAQAHETPAAAPTPWDYSGAGGPQAWGTMKPEYSTCATGQRQSPIDIRDGIAVDLEPVQFDYRKDSAFSVIDTGRTVQVNLAPGSAIQVLGRRYELLQFHFHRPSEERIGGRQFDMVAHLVHRDPEDRLAVVAVLLERGSVQPIVQTVWNNLPLEKHEAQPARVTLDLNALLPTDRRYYTYMGSLTTPPCSEGVLWMVMQQPVAVSAEQIDIFARLYPMNARPVQNAAGRLIKQSN